MDGKQVAARAAAAFDRSSLVSAMGSDLKEVEATGDQRQSPRADAAVAVRASPQGEGGGSELVVREGEIVGLAGLAGHGQTRLLLQIFAGQADIDRPVAFVAGDRQSDGVFNLWSIAENVTVASLRSLIRRGFISVAAEAKLARTWRERIGIRTSDMGRNILTLSGGNQQKVIFARALASDARIILMDDPMRGVDIGTKLEVYAVIRAEAASGRSFLWYTTELDELTHCDKVYVFRNGKISDTIEAVDFSEQRVLRASFAESGT